MKPYNYSKPYSSLQSVLDCEFKSGRRCFKGLHGVRFVALGLGVKVLAWSRTFPRWTIYTTV